MAGEMIMWGPQSSIDECSLTCSSAEISVRQRSASSRKSRFGRGLLEDEQQGLLQESTHAAGRDPYVLMYLRVEARAQRLDKVRALESGERKHEERQQ